ncbi:hypothetical protein Tco_1392453 [Tanacetum coccineum]
MHEGMKLLQQSLRPRPKTLELKRQRRLMISQLKNTSSYLYLSLDPLCLYLLKNHCNSHQSIEGCEEKNWKVEGQLDDEISTLLREIPLQSQISDNKSTPFAPQLHESAGGLPKTKLVSHSCSLAGSTSAIEVSIPIAFVLPGREHKCNESFKLRRSPALS